MFVRSTGLGRTLLLGRIAVIESASIVPSALEPPAEGKTEPMRMLMAMEILHPVHWTVRAFLDPSDLRHMVWLILRNPMFLLKALKFLFSKSPRYDMPSSETAEASKAAAAPGAPKPSAAAPKAGPGPIPTRTGPGPIPSRTGPGPVPSR
jgi:hypothetical protein